MMSAGAPSVTLEEVLSRVTEMSILSYYIGVRTVPCLISSPLRSDVHPSFSLFSPDGVKVRWKDFGTGGTGDTFDLLMSLWGMSLRDVLARIAMDAGRMGEFRPMVTIPGHGGRMSCPARRPRVDIRCRTREWRDYDEEYWGLYGVSLPWLRYAGVYPVSHKIVYKDGMKYVFPADRLAYSFVERKGGDVTMKIYQPLNRSGYKWCSSHDASVVGLWTKIPETGGKMCVCSSLKDALCLWSNTGIPSVYVQSETTGMGRAAADELRRRYEEVYICLDNDTAGIAGGRRLSAMTGFTNIVLPGFNGGKDISDLYRAVGHDAFVETMRPLFVRAEEGKAEDKVKPLCSTI